MNIVTSLVISICLASTQTGQASDPQIVKLKRSSGHVMSPQDIEAEKLKFTRPWPKDLLPVLNAISMRRPTEAISGLDWLYQELARHDTDSKEWQALWFEYRIYTCLLADYEGRIAERDKWLDEFPLNELDVRPFPDILTPLALARKITVKGYKMTSQEVAEFAKIKINENTVSELFGERKAQEIKDPRIWAEILAITRYKSSMRGLAEVHAERLWNLDKKQSLSALVLCRRLISEDKPEESLAMVNASMPYAPKGLVTDWLMSAKKMAEARINQKKAKVVDTKP